MSDPVSNREIEDVLSSIRRLVSVDKQTETAQVPQTSRTPLTAQTVEPCGNDETAPDGPSPTASEIDDSAREGQAAPRGAPRGEDQKLLLTPSFRVTDTDERAGHPDDHAHSAASSEEDAQGEDSLSLEQWQIHPEYTEIAEAEDLPSDATAWPAVNETGSDDAETPVAEEDEPGPERSDASEAEDHLAATASQDSAPQADEPVQAGADRELEARIAEVEAAVAARPDEWDPDGDDADDYYASQGALPWEDDTPDSDASQPEPVTEPEIEPEAEAREDAEAPAEAGDPDGAETHDAPHGSAADADTWSQEPSDEDATPEADLLAAMRQSRAEALSREAGSEHHDAQDTDDATAGNAAPEGAETAWPSDDTQPEASFASRRGTAPANPGQDTAQPARGGDWYSEDAVLDEDALRDLVADIVRQELQGTLGERITRNVRKLVRREIHRALMGQEFD